VFSRTWDVNSTFDSFDANRFELLDSLNDADRVAIATAYGWEGGRVESGGSGGWISARRGKGAGGGGSSGGGGWLSGLSAAPLAPPGRVGVGDLCGSDGDDNEKEEEGEVQSSQV
jgi:hypothetical protein